MKKIKLLIIEDEMAIRDMVRFALSMEEFFLIDAEDCSKAISVFADHIPDLILLDWMLPGMSGIQFIQWIKKEKNLCDIPIIMLTAKAEEENKVLGLTTGADDYITKPFSPKELIARVRTVLRRGPLISPNNELQYRELVLNTANHQVVITGTIINLSPSEYNMLHFFMKHPNKTYSRDQLITHIWGPNVFIDDRTIDVHIRRLRDKLKKFGYNHLIKTIRGAGYQFTDNDK